MDGHRELVEELIGQDHSYREIARLLFKDYGLPTSEGSIRRAVRRWGVRGKQQGEPNFDKEFERPGFKMDGDEAHITSDPRAWKAYLNNTDQLLAERGLDPEDWEIQNVVVNEWDWHGQTYKQLKVHLKRKRQLHMVVPARIALGKVWAGPPARTIADEPELVVFVGDQHAPFHDTELHKRFCQFLYESEPERAVLMGDTIDLPNISCHPHSPEWASATQECLDAGGQILLDYRQANQPTRWIKLLGNHEERIRRAVINGLSEFYGLRPAQIEGMPDLPPIHDPAYLLRLDELEVEYIRPHSSYKHAKYVVTPHLGAKHGEVARRGSGKSALALIDGLDHSMVIGHTHRQSLVQKTREQLQGPGRLIQAGEVGCMCKIADGLGYAPGPDWANGFMTASIWPDGTFRLDLATYVDNHLYWRSERY